MDVISSPSSFTDILLRLTLAAACGAALGANRELKQKPAGLRTHALVALGAALFTLLGLQLRGSTDQLGGLGSVIQGVIVGVGFVGGGVILRRDDENDVRNLSTAASIWVVAAVGAAAACGLWRSALISVGLALLILIIGGPVNRAIHNSSDVHGPKP